MSCTICSKTKPIPQCSGTLEIGAVASASVVVVVTEVATNRQRLIDGTVTLGILTIDLSDLGAFLSPNFLYIMHVYDDLESFGSPVDVTIGAVEYPCLNLSLSSIQNAATGVIQGATSIVLQIES